MALHPKSSNRRERILSFGGAGQGKTYDFYTIAQLSLMTKSDAKFYVVDCDVSSYSVIEDPKFNRLTDGDGNVVDQLEIEDEVYDWVTLNDTIDRFQKVMRPQDWLLIDMLSPAWQWCQGHFTEKVFSKDLDDYFLQARASMRNPAKEQAFQGWTDWPVINTMYSTFQNKLLRGAGNLFCTAGVKALNTDQAAKDIKLMFGPFGVVPVGQKTDPHLFQTILLKAATKPDTYEAITVKDRGREKMKGREIKDFAKDYLIKIGGWALA